MNVHRISVLAAIPLSLLLMSCDEQKKPAPAAASSAPAVATTATAAAASSSPPKPVAKPSHECPEGSGGEGTFKKPCQAEGATRMVEVEWTKKITDKGPQFRVKSKSDLEIRYGIMYAYFYDEKGKQLEVTVRGKKYPYKKCPGFIFGGPMKPKESFRLWFSCVNKKSVPEGTKHIEGEIGKVGFSGKDNPTKADTYWQNEDLTPDERPKGGVKDKKK